MYALASEVTPNDDETNESVLYRRLWLNVLLRAKEDADGLDLMFDNQRDTRMVRGMGKFYLTRESWDLRLVCEWAGVDMKKLIEVNRRRYYEMPNK